jgi:hypothetical protein
MNFIPAIFNTDTLIDTACQRRAISGQLLVVDELLCSPADTINAANLQIREIARLSSASVD